MKVWKRGQSWGPWGEVWFLLPEEMDIREWQVPWRVPTVAYDTDNKTKKRWAAWVANFPQREENEFNYFKTCEEAKLFALIAYG